MRGQNGRCMGGEGSMGGERDRGKQKEVLLCKVNAPLSSICWHIQLPTEPFVRHLKTWEWNIMCNCFD